LSSPRHDLARIITTMVDADRVACGLTGWPRTLPHLQGRLTHLDDELATLVKAAAGSAPGAPEQAATPSGDRSTPEA
jgi:hypothetical protein